MMMYNAHIYDIINTSTQNIVLIKKKKNGYTLLQIKSVQRQKTRYNKYINNLKAKSKMKENEKTANDFLAEQKKIPSWMKPSTCNKRKKK